MTKRIGWAAAVAIAMWAGGGPFAASQEFGPGEQPGAKAPAANGKADPAAARKKAVDAMAKQLGKLKPVDGGLKTATDTFVIGTAELNTATGHADVRFDVKQGQQETAEFLVDYIAGQSEQMLRKWHVFARLRDGQKSQEYLGQLRLQYDEQVAYQEQMKKIYAAASVRRC